MKRIALWTTACVLLVLAAAVAWLFTADLGFLKPHIEQRMSAASGREFAIDGPLHLHLGLKATVTADGIRWQDAGWAGQPDMLRVDRIEVDLDLPSAIRGPLLIERVLVRDASVHIARNAEGESNWAIFGAPDAEAEPAADEPRALIVRLLDVSDVSLTVEGPARPVPLEIELRSLHQAVGPDDAVATSLDASAGGREVSVTGRIETWSSLLRRAGVDYEVEARLDRVNLKSRGRIDSLAEPRRPELGFSVRGPALSDLFVLAGLGEQGVGDVNIEGSLAPRDDGPLVLALAGNLGQSQVEATGCFSDLQDLEHAELSAKADGPNLGRILALFGIDGVGEVPWSLDLGVVRNGSLLVVRESTLDIGDAKAVVRGELPEFPSLGQAKASARISGPGIERLRRLAPIPDTLTGPFTLDLDLDATAGGRDALRAIAETSLGRLSAEGSLGPPPRHIGSRAQFRFESGSLAALAAAWGIHGPAEVPLEVEGELELADEGIRLHDGAAAFGSHDATIAGLVGTATGGRGTALDVTLRGASLAGLGRTIHPVDGLPEDRYEIAATIAIDDAGYRIRDIVSSIGAAKLEGEALVSRRRDLGGSRARLAASGPALESLVAKVGGYQVRPGSFRFAVDSAIGDGRLRLDRVSFERDFASLDAKLALPWPLSFDSADFAIKGQGRDIRALAPGLGAVQLDSLPYSIAVDGNRRGSAWTVSRLDLKLGAAEAHVRGNLDYGDMLEASHLTIDGTIPSLAAIGTIDGQRLRDSPVGIHAVITSRDDGLSALDLKIDVDEGSIGGKVDWRPGEVPVVDAALRSDYLTLHSLVPGPKTEEAAEPTAKRTRLIPEVEIPFGQLRKIDGSLRLDIGELRRDRLELRDLVLFAELRRGALALHELRFRGKSGELRASALLEPAAGEGHAKIDLTADGLRLGLDPDPNFDGVTADLVAKLEARGTDLRELAGTADGFLLLDARDGRLPNSRMLQAIYGDLLDEIVSTINPLAKTSEYTQIVCVVAPVEVNAGRMTSAPRTLVLTDKVRILSHNAIDLRTEQIDMNVRTTPLKSLTISAAEVVNPYIKIVGTLAEPKLTIDEKGVLVAGGAAVATGGLSVLARATWDRLPRGDDPCGEAVKQAREALAAWLHQGD